MTASAHPLPAVAVCADCARRTFPAKRFCPACGGSDLSSEPLADHGEVYSWTSIPEPGGGDRLLALVNVGWVRILVPVRPEAGPVAVGDRVMLQGREAPPGYELAEVLAQSAS